MRLLRSALDTNLASSCKYLMATISHIRNRIGTHSLPDENFVGKGYKLHLSTSRLGIAGLSQRQTSDD